MQRGAAPESDDLVETRDTLLDRDIFPLVLAVLSVLFLATGSKVTCDTYQYIGVVSADGAPDMELAQVVSVVIWWPLLLLAWLYGLAALRSLRRVRLCSVFTGVCSVAALTPLMVEDAVPLQGHAATAVILLFIAFNAAAIVNLLVVLASIAKCDTKYARDAAHLSGGEQERQGGEEAGV